MTGTVITVDGWVGPDNDGEAYTWVYDDVVYFRSASGGIWEMKGNGEMGDYIGQYDATTRQLNRVGKHTVKEIPYHLTGMDLDGWVYPADGYLNIWFYDGVPFWRCSMNNVWEMCRDGTVGSYVGVYNSISRFLYVDDPDGIMYYE